MSKRSALKHPPASATPRRVPAHCRTERAPTADKIAAALARDDLQQWDGGGDAAVLLCGHCDSELSGPLADSAKPS